jgi:hypothetical protein
MIFKKKLKSYASDVCERSKELFRLRLRPVDGLETTDSPLPSIGGYCSSKYNTILICHVP